MKNLIFASLLTLVFTSYLNAQVIANFEDGAVTVQKGSYTDTLGLENAAIITNPVPEGINTSDSVALVERTINSRMWDGWAKILFDTTYFVGDNHRLYFKVYVDHPCRAFIRFIGDGYASQLCGLIRPGNYDSFITDTLQWVTLKTDSSSFDTLHFNEIDIQFGDLTETVGFYDVTAYVDDIELVRSLTQPEICMVTVDQSINKNMIIWKIPESDYDIDSVLIYKEITSGNFQQIGSVSLDDKNYFIDNESNPAQKSENYVIAFKDTSGAISEYSWYHQTIHLMMSYGIGGAINLAWNNYIGLNYDAFNIYRGSSIEDLQLLSTVSGYILSYTDLTPPSGDLYYVISVTNPFGCEVPTMKKSTQAVYSSTQSNMVGNTSGFIAADNVSIIPNPASNKVIIQSTGNAKELSVQVMSLDGKMQMKQRIINGSEMDVSSLNSGMYILMIDIDNNRVIKRLIIQ